MPGVARATIILVLCVLVLAGCAGRSAPPERPAPPPVGATRSIVLVHPYSGETVAVTYWRDGSYDPSALLAIAMLMRDRRTGEVHPIDPALVDLLHALRARLGLPPDTPIEVISGYRSPATNHLLRRTNRRVAANSYHTRGQAADIRIPGVPARQVAEVARALGRGGTAYYPRSRHVHIDTGPVRTWRVR